MAESDFFGQFVKPPTSSGEVILDNLEEHELVLAPRGGGCRIRYTAIADPGRVLTEPEVITVAYVFATADNSPLMVEHHCVLVIPAVSSLKYDIPLLQTGEPTYITITDAD